MWNPYRNCEIGKCGHDCGVGALVDDLLDRDGPDRNGVVAGLWGVIALPTDISAVSDTGAPKESP